MTPRVYPFTASTTLKACYNHFHFFTHLGNFPPLFLTTSCRMRSRACPRPSGKCAARALCLPKDRAPLSQPRCCSRHDSCFTSRSAIRKFISSRPLRLPASECVCLGFPHPLFPYPSLPMFRFHREVPRSVTSSRRLLLDLANEKDP